MESKALALMADAMIDPALLSDHVPQPGNPMRVAVLRRALACGERLGLITVAVDDLAALRDERDRLRGFLHRAFVQLDAMASEGMSF